MSVTNTHHRLSTIWRKNSGISRFLSRAWRLCWNGLPPMMQSGMPHPSNGEISQADLFAAITNIEANAIAANFSNETVPPPAQIQMCIEMLERRMKQIEEHLS